MGSTQGPDYQAEAQAEARAVAAGIKYSRRLRLENAAH